MIPPGPHVLSYSASSAPGLFAPSTALFLHPAGRQVAAWEWDVEQEVLVPVTDDDEIARWKHAVETFQLDSYLAPYDLRRYPTWQTLSNHLSAGAIEALRPISGAISPMTEELDAYKSSSAAEKALEAQLINSIRQSEEALCKPNSGRCFYTELPRLVKSEGLSPEELTALNMDKSGLLEHLLERMGGEERLLAEFQFAFLAFLLGHSLAGLTQWRNILLLMLSCRDAMYSNRTQLLIQCIQALHAQLDVAISRTSAGESEIIHGLLDDSFLQRALVQWLDDLGEESRDIHPGLLQAAESIKQLVSTRLGWSVGLIDLDENEDGPVVVDSAEVSAAGLTFKDIEDDDDALRRYRDNL